MSAGTVADANARHDLQVDVWSTWNSGVRLASLDVGNASLAPICSMIWAAMQEFLSLPVVDVGANVVWDRAAATAESVAIECHQRIDTHVRITSQLIKHLIAASTVAHQMDTTRILLMSSQSRDHVRGVAGAADARCFLSDALETRSDGSDTRPT